jgi:hypothetical protein
MGFELLHLIKRVELDVETHGPATFTLATEQPDNTLSVRYTSAAFDTGAQRNQVEFTMRGTTRARLYQATLYPAGACRLYGARMLAKALGQPGDNAWTWFTLPVRITQDAYVGGALPIRPTADDYSGAGLPIRPTSDAFAAAGLPIRPTSDEFQQGPLPLAQTSPLPQWVSIPVDPIEFQTPPYRPLAGEG